MTLALLGIEEARHRLALALGQPIGGIEGMAEALRAEVHARGQAPRAATIDRVRRAWAPSVDWTTDALKETCDGLWRCGDLILGNRGILHATPTRVVPVGDHVRIFSSLPTAALREVLGAPVAVEGFARTVQGDAAIADALAAMSGLVVPAEEWAGLDRAPGAHGAFLASLDQRLADREPTTAPGGLGDGQWQAFVIEGGTGRFRSRDEGRLWQAWTVARRPVMVWTAGRSPVRDACVELSPDDGARAAWALARQAGPVTIRPEADGDACVLVMPHWLPGPEYRWLSLRARLLLGARGGRWRLTAAALADTLAVLGPRLGFGVMGS